MWEAEGEVAKVAPDKVGCKSLMTLREIPWPEVTLIQKVAFGILAALEVYRALKFVAWAEDWLSGRDRSAEAAAHAAVHAAEADAVAYDAAEAAHAAALADVDLVALVHQAMAFNAENSILAVATTTCKPRLQH